MLLLFFFFLRFLFCFVFEQTTTLILSLYPKKKRTRRERANKVLIVTFRWTKTLFKSIQHTELKPFFLFPLFFSFVNNNKQKEK